MESGCLFACGRVSPAPTSRAPRPQGLGSRVKDLGSTVWGLGFYSGQGSRVDEAGFRKVWGWGGFQVGV